MSTYLVPLSNTGGKMEFDEKQHSMSETGAIISLEEICNFKKRWSSKNFLHLLLTDTISKKSLSLSLLLPSISNLLDAYVNDCTFFSFCFAFPLLCVPFWSALNYGFPVCFIFTDLWSWCICFIFCDLLTIVFFLFHYLIWHCCQTILSKYYLCLNIW